MPAPPYFRKSSICLGGAGGFACVFLSTVFGLAASLWRMAGQKAGCGHDCGRHEALLLQPARSRLRTPDPMAYFSCGEENELTHDCRLSRGMPFGSQDGILPHDQELATIPPYPTGTAARARSGRKGRAGQILDPADISGCVIHCSLEMFDSAGQSIRPGKPDCRA